MSDLLIAGVLAQKRREKGVSQSELAQYIGVSKASVSKWETGQSYPDITFLPLLAAYFSISIDELLNYQPQMTSEDIRILVDRLKSDFEHRPFDEVYGECQAIVKKYYTCYPLLYQMAIIYINHSILAEGADRRHEVIRESGNLCVKIRTESGQGSLIVLATALQAACALALSQPEQALELLGEENEPLLIADPLRADACEKSGKHEKAIEILQVSIYQCVIALCQMLAQLFTLYPEQEEKFRVVARRLQAIDAAFDLRRLHPGIALNLYLQMSISYAALHLNHDAITALKICWKIISDPDTTYILHSDNFFDRIDEWLCVNCQSLPISENNLQEQIVDVILNHPAFTSLEDEPAYQAIKREALNMKGKFA